MKSGFYGRRILGEPDLADPESCGEDLVYSAGRAMELAPRYCGSCEDHHFLAPAKRLAKKTGKAGIDFERARLIDLVAGHVGALLGQRDRPIDIVITGTVDTALLSTCAHAAISKAGAARDRVHFTVLDLCRTPLMLCRDYAEFHHLQLTTDAIDLIGTARLFPADILLNHSLFRFLPAGSHVPTLQKLGRWLKPDGRIIFSTIVKPDASEGGERARRRDNLATLRRKAEDGEIEISEPLDIFQRRLDRHLAAGEENKSEFCSPQAVRQLFIDAGMPIVSFEETSRPARLSQGQALSLQRVLAVLRAQDGQ